MNNVKYNMIATNNNIAMNVARAVKWDHENASVLWDTYNRNISMHITNKVNAVISYYYRSVRIVTLDETWSEFR